MPWLQEFSKKVLWGCYIAWISVLIYSAVVMQMAQDLSSLPTMIDGATTVMRDGVIGYCIKAAIENAIKIALSKKEKADDDPPAG